MKATSYFDGGCRPTNPGHAAFGIVMELDGEEHLLSRYLGWRSNNYAEYTGCIVAIKFAHRLGADELLLVTDSQLVQKQVTGAWKLRHAELRTFALEAQRLLERHFKDSWHLIWTRRANNTAADALCTSAINMGRNLNPYTPQKLKDKRPGSAIDPFDASDKTLRITKPPNPARLKPLSK